ncbi:hypothetical protein [Butyrivibrio sp. FCS014]|uniref:hypothetical protein n=1 Tax=Butyrivibrio sp. FCS014 TaxID=1408304 RepID=UPI0004649A5F|nr:hypothetical protein [Butyrivibrio sp. FCS014]
MKDIRLNDDQLNNVAGGKGLNIPPQRFNVGDKVLLRIYPEYGVGIVREAKVEASAWKYTVQFDAGMMTADEFEFIPA